jgi:hypothetical protein
MWQLRFSQRCCRGFKYFAIWRCVVEWVPPDISKACFATIFRVQVPQEKCIAFPWRWRHRGSSKRRGGGSHSEDLNHSGFLPAFQAVFRMPMNVSCIMIWTNIEPQVDEPRNKIVMHYTGHTQKNGAVSKVNNFWNRTILLCMPCIYIFLGTHSQNFCQYTHKQIML